MNTATCCTRYGIMCLNRYTTEQRHCKHCWRFDPDAAWIQLLDAACHTQSENPTVRPTGRDKVQQDILGWKGRRFTPETRNELTVVQKQHLQQVNAMNHSHIFVSRVLLSVRSLLANTVGARLRVSCCENQVSGMFFTGVTSMAV